MAEWIRHRRKGGQTPEPAALISIRPGQIAFNAHFAVVANLREFSHVSMFVDPTLFRVAFQFYEEARDRDVFAIIADGGSTAGKQSRGRCVQVAGLMRQYKWLAELAKIADPELRRFTPKWISSESMWVILICPPFENHISDKREISAHIRGIYRYRRGDETVYIGRGQIRSRLSAPERERWDFEMIEYSIIPDESEQIKWEAFWLDYFVQENGKLPIYNRLRGTVVRDGDGVD